MVSHHTTNGQWATVSLDALLTGIPPLAAPLVNPLNGWYLCQHFAFLLLTQLFVCECSFRLNPILPSINVAIWGMAHQLRLAVEKLREAKMLSPNF